MKKMLASLVVMAVIVSSSSAALFQDNFEGVPASSQFVHYSDNANFNPTAQVGTWTLDEGFDSTVQVTSDATAPQPGPASGSQYLAMSRMVYATGDRANLLGTLATPATNTAVVSFDLYLLHEGSFDGGNHSIELWLHGGAADWTTDFGAVRFLDKNDPGGAWSYSDTSYTDDNWVGYFPLNAWNHVDIAFDFGAAQSYTISFNGTVMKTDTFYRPTTQLSSIHFWENPTTNAFIDNVVVTPEPMTLCLLGLGGIALIRRK